MQGVINVFWLPPVLFLWKKKYSRQDVEYRQIANNIL